MNLEGNNFVLESIFLWNLHAQIIFSFGSQETGSSVSSPQNRDKMGGKSQTEDPFFSLLISPYPGRCGSVWLFLFFLKNSTWKELRNQLFVFDLICSHCYREAFIFSPPILTSHPCVFPAWAQHPCLWNGFAGHLLQARLQALQFSSSHSVSKLTWEAERLALRVEQVDPFSLYYLFWGELLHTFMGNRLLFRRGHLQCRLGSGRPSLCTSSWRVQAVTEQPGCKLLGTTN